VKRGNDYTFVAVRRVGRVMRRWVALLLMAGIGLPALGAKSLSIEQLEQLLAANQGKADAHVAQQLADVELTERVSPDRLAKWEKNFPGPKTHEMLIRLADTAAFLKTATPDLVPIAAPDSDTQEKMLALASEYVKTTITRLPNFYATRETTHFEDAPSQEQMTAATSAPTGWRTRPLGIAIGKTEPKPMHSNGTTSATVTYRDGYEVHDAEGTKDSKGNQPQAGLSTRGEFGPILSVVIGDVIRSQVTWSHWERSTGDPMAVLHYAVPEDQSNYLVRIPNGSKVEEVYPGYHGEIAIDPATGSILRLSIVADLTGPYQTMQTAILVEYAPVAIGDRTYICPVHGVAFAKTPVAGVTADTQGSVTVQTQLNDVVFTHYHLFGSEARIVADEKSNGAGSGAPPSSTAGPAAHDAAPAAAPAAGQHP
jgi:hypothetical protein